jgi:hypothetical protein
MEGGGEVKNYFDLDVSSGMGGYKLHKLFNEDGEFSDGDYCRKIEKDLAEMTECRDNAVANLCVAYSECVHLAKTIWRNNFADNAPEWAPLPGIGGVISQIDNMCAGLAEQSDRAKFGLRKAIESLENVPKEELLTAYDEAPFGETDDETWANAFGAVKKVMIEAVQRGFATWFSDERGNTTFTWKETSN